MPGQVKWSYCSFSGDREALHWPDAGYDGPSHPPVAEGEHHGGLHGPAEGDAVEHVVSGRVTRSVGSPLKESI